MAAAGQPALQLWLLPRDEGRLRQHLEAGSALLSKSERERAGRSRNAQAARRFVLGRVLMRRALGAHLGVDPARLVIAPDRAGKPALLEPHCPDLAFNLAHSRSEWAFALARGKALGVDLEPLDRTRAIGRIAATFYSAAERERLGGEPAAALQLWTLKEAVAKAIGQSVWQALRKVRLEIDGGRVAWLAPPPKGTEPLWSLALGRLREDHWLALALETARPLASGLEISCHLVGGRSRGPALLRLQASSALARVDIDGSRFFSSKRNPFVAVTENRGPIVW